MTSPHLNEPLDNPQKYDPRERERAIEREAVSPLSSFPAERLLTGLSPLCVEGYHSDTDEPVGTGERGIHTRVMRNTVVGESVLLEQHCFATLFFVANHLLISPNQSVMMSTS